MKLIKIIDKKLFAINAQLLGADEAQLWIGHGEGPKDDNDERVASERAEDIANGKIYGIEATDIVQKDGWYMIDTSKWPKETYRLMIHSKKGDQSPEGTLLQSARDLEYSWPKIDGAMVETLSDEQKKFIYKEQNGRGYCFRLEISEEEIIPKGNILL